MKYWKIYGNMFGEAIDDNIEGDHDKVIRRMKKIAKAANAFDLAINPPEQGQIKEDRFTLDEHSKQVFDKTLGSDKSVLVAKEMEIKFRAVD